MKKYLPIKIRHTYYGPGWWWGSYLFFFRHFAIVPMWYEHLNVRTEAGGLVRPYCGPSWKEAGR